MAGNRSIGKDFMNGTYHVFNTYLRFNEVAVGPKIDTALALLLTGERGHHNHLDVFGFGSAAQNIQHVKPADFWHHYITDN